MGRRPKKLITAGLAAALLLSALLLRGPVMSLVKDWRYESHLRKAEQAYAEDDLVRANRFAGAAMRLKPDDLRALRTLMELGVRIRSSELSSLALARFRHEDATLDDQVAVLELAQRLGDFALVSALLEELPEERRDHPAVQLCRADFLERSGRTLEAVDLVNRLVDSTRGEEAKLRLTRLLAGMEENPVASKRARALVAELMAGGGDEALPAFRNLRLLPKTERRPESGPVRDFLEWVAARDEAGPSDFLLAAEIDMVSAGESARSRIVEAMVERYRVSAPRELARWLLATGESKRILDLPEELLREDESFYAACLQVLIDEGRLEETKAWIANPHPGLSPILVDAVRAGVAFKEGDESGRVGNWQRAFEKARFNGKYGPYLAMRRIAERFGDGETVRKISTAIAQLPPRLLPATQNLEYLRFEFGDEPEFLGSFFQRLEASRPDDPLARHHLALHRIVTGTELEKAVATLEELARAHPKFLLFHCSLALGYLEQGSARTALDALEARRTDWNAGASHYERAAYALVQRRAGNVRAAERLEADIDWKQVPAYLRRYLQSAKEEKE